MLQRVIVTMFGSLAKVWRGRRRRDARARLASALERYAAGRYAEACALCEEGLALDPEFAAAHAVLGALACRGGDADAGARALERAVALSPRHAWYLAALGDARLLQQRVGDAESLYTRAFPRHAAALA